MVIVWCELCEVMAEVFWGDDRRPICFYPMPFAPCVLGNVCNETDDNFVVLSECEQKAMMEVKHDWQIT